MTRNTTFAPEEFYHIYNRGTEKRNIFSNRKDYERFLCLLYACNGESAVRIDNVNQQRFQQGRTLLEKFGEFDRGEPLVGIGVYCLMPNHFHFIIRESQEGGISRFMQKLTTAYTMYFNKKYKRSGALFQGKFKAIHINEDRYMKYLISYTHLNPVKIIDSEWKENGIKNRVAAEEYLEKYLYSSYLDYLGAERVEGAILNKGVLPDYSIEASGDFKTMITEWLDFNEVSARSNLAESKEKLRG